MVEKIKFSGLDAVRIENGKKDELIIVTEVGPRIMSFRPEGKENFFYVNESQLTPAARKSGSWSVYGGTRLWVSPETPLTYAPDNTASEVRIEKGSVTVLSPVDEVSRLRKIITIEAHESSFTITYGLRNEGIHLFAGGLWALSCVKPLQGAAIHLPWGDDSPWNVKDMKYWRGWLNSQGNVESSQWKPTNEFFTIRPTGETGKVGFANSLGFSIFTAGNLSFIKKTDYIASAPYPDGGCSCEIYTSKDFYEIETLSPVYTLKPFLTSTHVEHWWAGFDKIETGSIKKAYETVDSLFRH
jgi:hypothetical protein